MVASWVLDDWFQVVLYIGTFAMMMILMEFGRWFPAINLYLSILAFFILFPMQIGLFPGIDAGGFGTTAKFLLIVPFNALACA